ncbi:hypothetical protein FB389_1988 [Rarobacter incanus]|uniref:Uncharacterized protein n=2 Tax=Rarobacter incanus TaxID=153494 RepID=A0A542SRM8_9MICO|nr:hypothetical protein FB389_1988 [Rarobacter incanus]
MVPDPAALARLQQQLTIQALELRSRAAATVNAVQSGELPRVCGPVARAHAIALNRQAGAAAADLEHLAHQIGEHRARVAAAQQQVAAIERRTRQVLEQALDISRSARTVVTRVARDQVVPAMTLIGGGPAGAATVTVRYLEHRGTPISSAAVDNAAKIVSRLQDIPRAGSAHWLTVPSLLRGLL